MVNTNMKTFREFICEGLADRLQYDYAKYAYDRLSEKGVDVLGSSFEDLKSELESMGLGPTTADGRKLVFKNIEPKDGWHVFITRIKSVAKNTTNLSDFEPNWG